MRDFTLNIYRQLLLNLLENKYSFLTFEEFILNKKELEKIVVLRHDVDKLPLNSLQTALIEHELKIKGTYYFRIGKESNDPDVIKQIAAMGHEIGYHYENIDFCNGNKENAYLDFCKNLEYFRSFYPVKTICMHGRPLSKFDNRKLWETYNYHDLGIIAEPYFDVDFNKILYVTETGRRWNGDEYSVIDKVVSNYNYNFRSTFDIFKNLYILPSQIMITVHPQRWNDNYLKWTKELILQNIKNVIKKYFFVK